MFSETEKAFITFCLFHNNTDTPSFAVNKYNGTAICFNQSCNYTGNLFTLTKRLSNRNYFETLRFIEKKGSETKFATVNELLNKKPFEFTEWRPDIVERMQYDMWHTGVSSAGLDYLVDRGFTVETIKHFNVGYSIDREMIAIPLYSPKGLCVGVIGRSVYDKEWHVANKTDWVKNSAKLPRNHTLFNIQNAKTYGSICIITEAALDAMKVHQAGYPNVVATVGSSISDDCIKLLDMYFDTLIMMTDNDHAGRALARAVATSLPHKNIMWAVYSNDIIMPEKDPAAMSETDIIQCIDNCMSDYEYAMRFEM